ncbi:CNH domain-containing protein [Mycotypha africana]|uniref:CNH domain-containing protein n=1 Tax=Mycotypha africana TaxID=64632 RepID=UPI0023009C36|nr:CNH domain-containing protein [Mycotypha africana]KAI8981674.1 CNH domain-containing protein [Mycotypha africana]
MQQPEILINTPPSSSIPTINSGVLNNSSTKQRGLTSPLYELQQQYDSYRRGSGSSNSDYKRSFTVETLNEYYLNTSSGKSHYINSSSLTPRSDISTTSELLTPSAAIRDQYYKSSRYLQDNDGADELMDDDDDNKNEGIIATSLMVNEKLQEATGDILDYRPGVVYTKPNDTQSIYTCHSSSRSTMNDSVISLRTAIIPNTTSTTIHNDTEEEIRSISSTRTVDDQLQGRKTTILGGGSNMIDKLMRKKSKISRSASIFNKKKPLEQQQQQQQQQHVTPTASTSSLSLLSKLSKSTAPMRAKLFHSSTNPQGSVTNHGNSIKQQKQLLTLPGKKHVAESVYNLPITTSTSSSASLLQTPNSFSAQHYQDHRKMFILEKSQSIATLNMPPQTASTPYSMTTLNSAPLSTSSSTNSAVSNTMVTAMTLVDEPDSYLSTPNSNTVQEDMLLSNFYPALLSNVAQVFKNSIITSTKSKDSIKYKDAFDGREAVDKLAHLIRTKDRNLALLLGRALDAQKFFHDVNYEHHLRDSTQELYQFKDQSSVIVENRPRSEYYNNQQKNVMIRSEFTTAAAEKLEIEGNDLNDWPNGVFTILTDCYSPTCTKENVCYSVRCPRRQEKYFEQQQQQQQKQQEQKHPRANNRLSKGPPYKHSSNSSNSITTTGQQSGRQHSREGSLTLLHKEEERQQDRLWINTVPQTILDSLTKEEKKRQENIFELIYTEKDFVDDLNYIKTEWIDGILENEHITGDKATMVHEIFWNIEEVLQVNSTLSSSLLNRQAENPVVNQVGDIMLSHVAQFEPFVRYGAHQVIGKYMFEMEKSRNPSFLEFVRRTERLPQSRKLELNGYLTKPTTRLGRYNLLLREILKHTPTNHPDQETIPRVMTIISKFLTDVNRETGKTENAFNLQLLNDRLINKHISNFDLDLTAPNRQLIMKGSWKKGPAGGDYDIVVYLLDHCLLFVRAKQNEEKYKLHKKPIPLALLSLSFPDHTRRASTILPLGRPSNISSTDLLTYYNNNYNDNNTNNNNSHHFTAAAYTNTMPIIPQKKLSTDSLKSTSNHLCNTNNTISHSPSQPQPPIYSTFHTINNSNSTYTNLNSNVTATSPYHNNNNQGHHGYPISFVHLGKQSTGIITLYAPTLATRKQWVDKIEGQRKALVEKHKVLHIQPANENFFSAFNKVNCAAVFDNGKSLLLGGDQGVYLKKEGSGDNLIRILAMDKVSQIDILEQSNLILVLADKNLYTYSLDSMLNSQDSNAFENSSTASHHTVIKRGRKISSHVAFFKVGCIFDKLTEKEKTLICYVKNNAMTSTIRALEPLETTSSTTGANGSSSLNMNQQQKNTTKKKIAVGKKFKFRGHHEAALKAYKDLYIPGEATSIQFFKNIICVGSERGFQMVNISSAEVQSVLDPNDESNNSLLQLYENMKPISMFRHKDGNILLCYDELAFYIDKKGKRVRKDWFIAWEGNPTAFAFRFPYVVAFNINFIEVRHIDTGDLLQVIPGNNIRCLIPDSTDRIFGVMDDRMAGSEVIFELKLVDSHRRKMSMIKNNSGRRRKYNEEDIPVAALSATVSGNNGAVNSSSSRD